MRLFKRDNPANDAPRCPSCGERVPDGVHECAMCGYDLADGARDGSRRAVHAEGRGGASPSRR
jgi:ribosomal protein L37AE/L43A